MDIHIPDGLVKTFRVVGRLLLWAWRIALLAGVVWLIVRPFWQGVVDWTLVLGFTKVLVWPVVVFYVLYLLRHRIPTLLDNGLEMATGLLSLKVPPAQPAPQQSTPESAASEGIGVPPTPDAPAAPTVADVEKWSETLTLAAKYIDFERIYRLMYASQLEALNLLRLYPNGLAPADLQPTLEKHIARASAKKYPSFYRDIRSFMGFLTGPGTGLANYDPNIQRYFIAPKGIEFMTFLAETMKMPLDSKYDTNI